MNTFEVFMNGVEDRAKAAMADSGRRFIARMGAFACRKVAKVYLCLEQKADFNRRLRASVNHRMAHAMWIYRAQRLATWGGLSS